MKKFKYITLLFITFLCAVNLIYAQKLSRKEYINKYKDIAVRQMNQYSIPASIILAQACLESGNGNSSLAVKANNHFGIKCHNSWTGKRYKHDDDKRRECFRKYNSAEDSFKDHSEFLKNGKRYQSLFDLDKTDYKKWAYGLKAAGYATNPKYAQMLIEIIETNQLYQYDTPEAKKNIKNKDRAALRAERRQLKLQKKPEKLRRKQEKLDAKATAAVVPAGAVAPTGALPVKSSSMYKFSMDRQIYKQNGVPYIISREGDTYAMLAKEYNLFTKEILSFNDLHNVYTIAPGTMVYIQRKKKKGEKSAYVVVEGDTMYKISQRLAIRLDYLYKLNGMSMGSEAEVGKILNLQ